jgi:hypothetical protein
MFMASAILNCKSFVPPLLEGQLTPAYHTTKQLLHYLQKWREYLFWLFSDFITDAEPQSAQSKVDEFINTIILACLVNQHDATAIPTIEELLLQCSNDRSFYDIILGHVHNSVLRSIFEPEDNNIPYWHDIKKLAAISNFIKALDISYLLISIIGSYHQLCLDIPIADIAISKQKGNRRKNGAYYTPAPLSDYLVYHALEDAFEGKRIDQIINQNTRSFLRMWNFHNRSRTIYPRANQEASRTFTERDGNIGINALCNRYRQQGRFMDSKINPVHAVAV